MNQARELLRFLWEGSTDDHNLHGEFRAYGKQPEYNWLFPLTDMTIRAALLRAEDLNNRGYHVAHAVHPKTNRTGKGCLLETNTPAFVAAVMDFDSVGLLADGLTKLEERAIEPSAIVLTGSGGGHVYLKLAEPAERTWFKPIARRICKATGSDNTFDGTRVLRTPGTVNWKYDPAPVCTILTMDKHLYLATDLEDAFPEEVTVKTTSPPRCGVLGGMDATARIDAVLRGQWSLYYNSRSEATFAVANALIKSGKSQSEAESIMLASVLGERDEKDIARCLKKVVETQLPVDVSTVEVLFVDIEIGHTKVKFEVIDGPHAGKTFRQPIFHTASIARESFAECFGSWPEDVLSQGTPQARGRVALTTMNRHGKPELAVRYYYPAQTGRSATVTRRIT